MNHFHNVGDWVLFEFSIVQIREMDGPKIQEVNDGLFTTSGRYLNVRVQLLTMRNKVISEEFETASKEIHATNNNQLNYPDIQSKLVDLWIEACDLPPTPPKEKELQKIYTRLREFKDNILSAATDQCRALSLPKSEGVSIFKKPLKYPPATLK